MVHIFFIEEFYTEIVHHQREGERARFVMPKARRVHTFVISEWGQFLSEALVCKDARLWQPPHCPPHFNIHPPIQC